MQTYLPGLTDNVEQQPRELNAFSSGRQASVWRLLEL